MVPRCALPKAEDAGLGGFRRRETGREPGGRVALLVFHCFACQASGNVLPFVAAMEKCSIRQAALRWQQWFSLGAPDGSAATPARRSGPKGELVREKEERNPPLPFALTGVHPSHPYRVERGVDRATAVEFGVGF